MENAIHFNSEVRRLTQISGGARMVLSVWRGAAAITTRGAALANIVSDVPGVALNRLPLAHGRVQAGLAQRAPQAAVAVTSI